MANVIIRAFLEKLKALSCHMFRLQNQCGRGAFQIQPNDMEAGQYQNQRSTIMTGPPVFGGLFVARL
jgi:hypothetical protein